MENPNKNPNKNPNNEQRQNDEIMPQNLEEIESLNNSDELNSENLEAIQGGLQLDGCIDYSHCGNFS